MTDLVLADDHAAFAQALAEVLDDDDRRVVAVACTAEDALEAVRTTSPDLCLIDRWFDDVDGLDLLPAVRAACSELRIIVFTADPDHDGPRQALSRGADGFVHKTRGVSALLSALDHVLEGETVVELPPRWTTPRRIDPADPRQLATHLTERERQCLALLVDGLSTPEMAARLGVGITTVRTHVQGVLMKLGVHTRLEAAAHAVRHGIVVQEADARWA